jgi:putative ABC transport system substrate-binding protein
MPRSGWESSGSILAQLEAAARQSGFSLTPSLIESPAQELQYLSAFTLMAEGRVEAVLVASSPENLGHARLIIELAEKARLPALYPYRLFPDQGGLMSYGADFPDLSRHAAGDIAQILNGVQPADIPFYQPSRFEPVINLKAARALGIDMPATLLGLATEVIE